MQEKDLLGLDALQMKRRAGIKLSQFAENCEGRAMPVNQSQSKSGHKEIR